MVLGKVRRNGLLVIFGVYMKIRHLIITRFNVASPGREAAIRLKRGWLEERFKLFEEICMPGVSSQTNKNFEWVVFFDVKTPDEFKSRINELVKLFPFRPVYTDNFDMQKLGPTIAKDFEAADYLLTSRLDSDDVISDDYVDTVQAIAIERKGRFVINFDQGAILQFSGNKMALYEYWDHSNPFASMVEPFDCSPTTIWGAQHTEIKNLGEILHVSGRPMWLQVVHGGNVSNRVRGKRVSISAYDKFFMFMRSISSSNVESRFELVFDIYVFGVGRQFKEAVRKVVKLIYKSIVK